MFQNKVYEEGQIIEGIITSIKKYGAFFSFEGGYIGLLHISEISSNFVNNIHNFFKIGDTVKVVVKKVDNSTKFLIDSGVKPRLLKAAIDTSLGSSQPSTTPV